MSLSLLLAALQAGSVRFDFDRIAGYCGCLYADSRTIVINPEASRDEQEAELHDQLRALLAHDGVELDLPCPHPGVDGPLLRLVEGT